jgi:uncharacterized membrane protein
VSVRGGVIASVGVVLASAVCSLAGLDVTAVRAALAIPAVLVAPGFVLLAAIGLLDRLALWERVVYTVAASLGLGVLVGVALGALSALTTTGVALGFALVTAALAVVALARTRRRPEAESGAPPMRIARGHVALFGLAGAIVVVAFAVAITGARDQEREQRFPELSLVPPRTPAGAITVGVRNNNTHSAGYTVRVLSGNRTLRTWRIKLGADQSFSAALPASSIGRRGVRALLVGSGGATVRHVDLSPATLASYGA